MQLTEKVLAYKAGYWIWKDLWKDLFLAIDQFLQSRAINPELGATVLAKLTPRLPSMVDSFHYRGTDFEAFLFTAVRFQIKTVHAQNRRDRERTESLELYQSDHEACGFALADSDHPGDFPIICGDGMRNRSARCAQFSALSGEYRRLIIVALKNCAALTDELCLTLATKLGIDLTWLMDCRDELCELSRPRMDIYRKLRERERAAIFAVRCQAPDLVEERKRRERLQLLRDHLARMNPYPRHQDIALVLGIPKGTVDSSLYYVRRSLGVACKKSSQTS